MRVELGLGCGTGPTTGKGLGMGFDPGAGVRIPGGLTTEVGGARGESSTSRGGGFGIGSTVLEELAEREVAWSLPAVTVTTTVTTSISVSVRMFNFRKFKSL
jgi:hypothetical protein